MRLHVDQFGFRRLRDAPKNHTASNECNSACQHASTSTGMRGCKAQGMLNSSEKINVDTPADAN